MPFGTAGRKSCAVEHAGTVAMDQERGGWTLRLGVLNMARHLWLKSQ